MFLYHYFDETIGPFKNLSDLPINKADEVLNFIRINKASSRAAKRDAEYMKRRIKYEALARKLFVEKGGKPKRQVPHYMVLEPCEWINTWFIEGRHIKIPIEEFDMSTISFTYGDMHPTFSPYINDGKEYRKKIYTYEEILELINKYGLPQEWNADGKLGPERYIEVQIWSNDIIEKYISQKLA